MAQPTEIRILGDYTKVSLPRVAKCRSCQAEILWFTTAAELRPMPVDRDPLPLVKAVYHDGPKPRSIIVAVPHWATCPQYKEWRRGR